MATPPTINGFEGGVNGNAVSTSDAGPGETHFDAVGGTACVYSNARVMHGGLSMLISTPANNSKVQWNGLGAFTINVFFGHYLYVVSYPAGGFPMWQFFPTGGVGGVNSYLNFQASGTLSMSDLNDTNHINGVVPIPLGRWVYIAGRVFPSTTVGQIELRWWADITNPVHPTESLLATGIDTSVNVDGCGFGVGNADANFIAYFDDIAVSTGGWLGVGHSQLVPPQPIASGF